MTSVGNLDAFLLQAALEASERADQCAHKAFDKALGFLKADQAESQHDAFPPVELPLYRYHSPTTSLPCPTPCGIEAVARCCAARVGEKAVCNFIDGHASITVAVSDEKQAKLTGR